MGRRTVATLGVVFLLSVLSGCCSDEVVEPAPPVAELPAAPVEPTPVAPIDGDEPAAEAEPPSAPESEPEKPKTPPAEVLNAMAQDELSAKLLKAGWTVEAKSKKIKDGREFYAAHGEHRVRITWQEFAKSSDTDKFMFKAEKSKDAAIGRMDDKMVVVFPSKDEPRSVTNAVLGVIMSPAPSAEEEPAGTE